MDFPITQQQFNEWLLAKQPETVVGICTNAGTCPIAQAVLELTERQVHVCHVSWVELDGDAVGDSGGSPKWVHDTVLKVDDARNLGHDVPLSITAGEVKELLGLVSQPEGAVA